MRRRDCLARVLIVASSLSWAVSAQALNHPFGSHPQTYAAGSILPNHLPQATLDQQVADFYDAWKATYLSPECGPGRYVVLTSISNDNLTVSEGHGYGMMITALMAGHDPDARTIFDGMYIYFREHPTSFHSHLMAWNQNKSCNDVQGVDSASDGDLDIAFALLLADKQWGSAGAIDYLSEAKLVIADVLDGDVDTAAQYITLGDWVTPSDSTFYPSTRSSDFMPDHYRAFADATANSAWTGVIDRTYTIVNAIQTGASPVTGLLPDFIKNPLTSPVPVAPNFLEGPTDNEYAFNAARDPWRLGTDFVVSGDARASVALGRINSWIRAKTGDDPSKIRAGYKLNGNDGTDSGFISLAFIAPMGVGAMVDAVNQTWLNSIWDFTVARPLSAEGYFENTLKMLSMIVMSGNWWSPDQNTGGGGSTGTALCTNPALVFGLDFKLKKLAAPSGDESMKIKGSVLFANSNPASLVEGAQILVEDMGAGSAVVYDLSQATTPIAPMSAGVCTPKKDGWKATPKKVQYKNRSGAIDPPTCTAMSANGLSRLKYKIKSSRDMDFLVKTRRSTLGPIVGPLRFTLVFGSTAQAGTAGECAVSPAVPCVPRGSGLRCR